MRCVPFFGHLINHVSQTLLMFFSLPFSFSLFFIIVFRVEPAHTVGG
jgi:hypothetical protein